MAFPPPTEKQARILWISITALSIAILVAVLAGFVWGLGLVLRIMSPVLWPLAIGGIIAYLLDPVVDLFERRKVARGWAILLVFALCVLCVAGVFASVAPRLISETEGLIASLPKYSKELKEDVNRWMAQRPFVVTWKERFFPGPTDAPAATTNTVTPAADPAVGATNGVGAAADANTSDGAWTPKLPDSVLQWLSTALPKMGSWLLAQLGKVASWAGMVIGLALVPVFTFYFLQEKQAIQKGWTNYLPVQESKFKDEMVFVIRAINDYLIVFFRGQVVVAGCIGVLLTIGFLAMGLNYAVLLGLLAGVLSIVPYLGAVLTIVPCVLLAAVQFKDWLHPLLVIVVFAIVQMLEGFVISPKIMGDRVGLHPLTIIVAVLVGTTLLGGILGGILAIPLTAALRVLMFRYVWRQHGGEKKATRR